MLHLLQVLLLMQGRQLQLHAVALYSPVLLLLLGLLLLLLQWQPQVHVQQHCPGAPPAAQLLLLQELLQHLVLKPQHRQLAVKQPWLLPAALSVLPLVHHLLQQLRQLAVLRLQLLLS
jgi:hypothetical protein